MPGLAWSVADAWHAPRLGLSGKKMWVVFRSLLLGFPGFLGPAYLAWLIAGYAPAAVWRLHRFFPPPPPDGGLFPLALWDTGAVLALLVVLIGATGVARITYRQLKGDNFYGRTEGWRFALEHGRSTLGAPVIIAVLFLLISLLLVLLGVVSSIPAVGPIILGISIVPALVTALFGIYTGLALAVSLLYAPAIVGCTGEDAIEGAIQSFSLLWTVPWRTAVMTAAAALSTAVAGWLLATGALLAHGLLGHLAGGVMGATWRSIEAAAVDYLPIAGLWSGTGSGLWPEPLADLLPTVNRFAEEPQGLAALAALLGGLSLLVVLGVIIAYLISSLVSGLTAAWLVLRRHKDGEDLLAWADDIDSLETVEPDA